MADRLSITLLLCIAMLSCSQSELDNIIKIRIDSATDELSIEHVIDSVIIVKLEDTPLPIGTISKINFVDDKIIIEDRMVSKAIFVFDQSGHFLNHVGGRGRGVGEYYRIHATTVKQDTKEIVVLNNTTALYYSLDGTFKKKEDVSACGSDFVFLNNGQSYFYLDNGIYFKGEKKDYQLLSLDNKEFVSGTLPALPTDFYFTYQYNNFFSYNGLAFFCPTLSDHVYSLSDKGAEPIYQIEIEGSERPQGNDLTTQNYIDFTNRYRSFNGMFIDFRKLAWFELSSTQKEHILYNKETKKTFVVSPSDNPIYRFFGKGISYAQKDDKYIVNEVYPYTMMEQLDQMDKEDPNYLILEEIIKDHDIDENSNPLLFFYRVSQQDTPKPPSTRLSLRGS